MDENEKTKLKEELNILKLKLDSKTRKFKKAKAKMAKIQRILASKIRK